MDIIDGFADSYEMSNTSTTSFFASPPAPTDNADSSFVYPAEQLLSKADVSALQVLSNSLESVFDSPEDFYSDAKLVLSDGREVPFHRCVLSARSRFFKIKLAAAVAEKGENSSSVKLELNKIAKDYEVGFDSVVTVLAYVYSSRVRPPSKGVSDCADENCRHEACRPAVDFMLEILYLAFIFEIPELVTMYQRHLLDVLHKVVIEDTLVILKLANICGEACKKLHDRCIEIIVQSDVDRVSLDKSLPQDIVKHIIDIRKQLGLVEPELEKHVSNIYKALDSDDVALVEMLLKEGHTNLDDAYALHYAAAYCDVKTAQDLLNLDLADVNHKNPRGYTVLHMAAMRKEPKLIGSLLTKGANASDLSTDGRTALLIAEQVTKAAEYNTVPETGKPSPEGQGRLCVEILQHADNHDPFPIDVSSSLAVATDELIDLENRVVLAQRLFPSEAQIAMDIAQMKGTSEFTMSSLEHDGLTGAKRTSSGLKITPDKILEKHQTRLTALSKTVELGKRFFPRCAAYLDQIMDNSQLNGTGKFIVTSLEHDRLGFGKSIIIEAYHTRLKDLFKTGTSHLSLPTPEEILEEYQYQNKKRYMEIQETVMMAFS